MKKIALLKLENMGEYEKEQGKASYRTIIDRYIGDIVLCNNIEYLDESVFENMGEDAGAEIYQYYLCNTSFDEDTKKQLGDIGVILSYSNMLECDVLCVDHWGTSWDYVLTEAPLFDTWEELEQHENE